MKKLMLTALCVAAVVSGASVQAMHGGAGSAPELNANLSLNVFSQTTINDVLLPLACGAAAGYVAENQVVRLAKKIEQGKVTSVVPFAVVGVGSLAAALIWAGVWGGEQEAASLKAIAPKLSLVALGAFTAYTYRQTQRPESQQDDLEQAYDAATKPEAAAAA